MDNITNIDDLLEVFTSGYGHKFLMILLVLFTFLITLRIYVWWFRRSIGYYGGGGYDYSSNTMGATSSNNKKVNLEKSFNASNLNRHSLVVGKTGSGMTELFNSGILNSSINDDTSCSHRNHDTGHSHTNHNSDCHGSNSNHDTGTIGSGDSGNFDGGGY